MPAAASDPTPFQQILLGTDGTVTRILEAYTEEPVDAVKLSQDIDFVNENDAPLELADGTAVLRRRVLLRGRTSGKNLLYAEATIAPERVQQDLLDALVTTDEPLGRLIAQSRMETFREVLLRERTAAGSCAPYFDITPEADLLARTYRIVSGGKPVMLITEKFPAGFFRDLQT